MMEFIVLGLAGWGLLRLGYVRSRLGRVRKGAEQTAAELEGETDLYQAVLDRSSKRVEADGARYAAAQREAQMQAVPLEALRRAGAANVRWAALKDAGVETLADVYGQSSEQLEAIPGVGPTSAERVIAAAETVLRDVLAAPLTLPSPDLTEAHAAVLATSAWMARISNEKLGDTASRLQAQAAELQQRMKAIRRKAGFFRWLVLVWRRPAMARAVDEARKLAAVVSRQVESAGLAAARETRGALEQRLAAGLSDSELRSEVRGRYAEYCAMFEEAFRRVPGERAPTVWRSSALGGAAEGALPAEIVRRVEAVELRTSELRCTLRGYQAFCVQYLLTQRRTLLGDEMGLGKTIEALAAMVHLRQAEGARRFLVIGPAGVSLNWEGEIKQRTNLRPYALRGSARDAEFGAWLREGGVAVVSYDSFRLSQDEWIRALGGTSVDLLVVDEAHFVKNPMAARAQAVAAIMPHAGRACFLTGTPLMNRVSEFQELVRLLQPEVANSLGPAVGVVADVIVTPERFHEIVAPVYLRRNKEDMLKELPPKIEKNEWVLLSDSEEQSYRAAVWAKEFMRMRRAVTEGAADGSCAKMDRLGELLEEYQAGSRKVLVFSFFRRVLARLEKRFTPVGCMHGELPVPERMQLVRAFHEGSGHAILVSQIDVGGVGLNLQGASVVVLMEPQWNPARENQAIDRAHRMGQTESVLVHRLLAKDSVDERMVEILAEKQDVFNDYAKRSKVKEASPKATEIEWERQIVDAEHKRLFPSAA